MLGSNDVKTMYHVADDEIGKGIEELARIAQNTGVIHKAKILIIAPPLIKPIAAFSDPRMTAAPEKSRLFASAYKSIAEKYQV